MLVLAVKGEYDASFKLWALLGSHNRQVHLLAIALTGQSRSRTVARDKRAVSDYPVTCHLATHDLWWYQSNSGSTVKKNGALKGQALDGHRRYLQ